MKYFLLIVPAVVVDMLKFFLWASFFGLTAAVGWVPIVGQLVSVGSIVLDVVISFCLNVGGGVFILTLLLFSRMFYPLSLGVAFLLGVLPVPGWTGAVLWSIWKKSKEEKSEEEEELAYA